jgi:hypothetical protein
MTHETKVRICYILLKADWEPNLSPYSNIQYSPRQRYFGCAMKKEKTGNGKKNTDGIRKELIIAGIGLFGTILAAVISVWGNWAQSKMIINATQTVEAIFAHPANTSTSQPITATPQETGQRWDQHFEVEMIQSICHFTTQIIPEPFTSDLGKPDVLDIFYTAGTESWSFGPSTSYPVGYAINISNISTNTVWPKISNSFQFTVSWVDNAPEHADVLVNGVGCGGGSWRDGDMIVSLSPEYLSTRQKVIFEDSDYYSLQRGESEVFIIQVQCKGPGIYLLDVDIPYTFSTDWDVIDLKASKYIICPETYSRWDVNPSAHSIVFYKNLSWDNESQGYVEVK